MRFIDLFSGIGGFRLGMERNNHECVWSCDNDKYANIIYKNNFGGDNHYTKNIRQFKVEEIPNFDILCAGFPCQSFSVAGKRKGFEDTRGTLFFEIARIIEAKKPKLLFLENVKGLLSAQDGYCFQKILETLDELGYDAEWQVLNSKHFGVPQNRERVFIIGHLRGTSSKKIFPLGEDAEKVSGISKEKVYDVYNKKFRKDGIAGALKGKGVSETSLGTTIEVSPIYDKNGKRTSEAYRIYDNKGVSPSMINQISIMDYRNDEGFRIRKEQISPNLMASKHSETDISMMPPMVSIIGRTSVDGKKHQSGVVLDKKGLSPCLWESMYKSLPCIVMNLQKRSKNRPSLIKNPSAGGHGTICKVDEVYAIDSSIGQGVSQLGLLRRLTPTECERLQGFPDGWTEGVSDTQRYKCLGNAVTVNVIEVIAKVLK